MAFASRTIAGAVVAALLASMPPPAVATGTINIHRSNGSSESYGDVEIKVLSGSLFLTSDDGDGTIVVTRAACSFQGKLMICFPSTAALVQDGESNALAIKTGTIYFNDTNDAQPLMLSSAKVPGDSVMLALTLRDGTFIEARGQIDEVVRQ